MKPLVIVLVLVGVAGAKDKPNPAEFTESAHVISAAVYRSRGHYSSYDPSAKAACPRCLPGRTTSGGSRSQSAQTELQLGNLVYITENVCKQAEVGSDYPAKSDHKTIKLLVGNKVCKYEVEGMREAK